MTTALRERVFPAWLTRDAGLVVTGRLWMSVSRVLAGVITPIYLAEIGWSAVRLGILLSTVAIASAVMTAAVGFLSDRFGRKIFLILIPVLAACGGIMFASTTATVLLFFAASIGSFGRGTPDGGAGGPYRPAEVAILASSVDSEHRNSLFGRLAFAASAGALLGSQLAVIPDVLQNFGVSTLRSYHASYLVISGFTFLAAVVAIPIRERREDSPTKGGRAIKLPRRSMRFLVKLWIANSAMGFAFGFVGPFLTYWLHLRYDIGPGAIGTMYAVTNAASMVAVLAASKVAYRMGLVRTVVISRLVQSGALVAMVLMPAFWLAGLMYMLRMLAVRLSMPLGQSYYMAMVHPDERSTVAGLANLPAQGTSAASPTIGGWLFDSVRMSLPFELAAVFQLVNTALFYVFFRNLAPPEEVGRVSPMATLQDRSAREIDDGPAAHERGPTRC